MRAPERLGPYVYRQSDTCFPLGGDSLALAAFASVRRGDRVCDLGCGAGALLQRDSLGIQLLGAALAHFQQDVPHHTAFQQGLDALLGACLFCFILNGRNQTHAAAASQTNFDT